MYAVPVIERIMKGDMAWSRAMKDNTRKLDRSQMLKTCTLLIVNMEERVGWVRLWDATLDLVVHHIRGLQVLGRLMSHHSRGCQPCPLCVVTPVDGPAMEHILSCLNVDTEHIMVGQLKVEQCCQHSEHAQCLQHCKQNYVPELDPREKLEHLCTLYIMY